MFLKCNSKLRIFDIQNLPMPNVVALSTTVSSADQQKEDTHGESCLHLLLLERFHFYVCPVTM